MPRYLIIIFFWLLAFVPPVAQAELTIEIVGGASQQIPIAIVPFSRPGQTDGLTPIISADLRRSGLFRTLETRGVASQPHDLPDVKYADWSALQAQALVIGKIEPLAGGKMKVSFRLLDVIKQTPLAGLEYERQIVETLGELGVLRPEGSLPDRHGALLQGPGLVVGAGTHVGVGEAAQHHGHIGVLGTQRRL